MGTVRKELKRAVWLTSSQRQELMNSATRAFAAEGSNQEACQNLIQELSLLEERISGLGSVIRSMVLGLRMPEDALPVYINSIEVRQMSIYGNLRQELVELLDPSIPIPPIPPSPDKPRRTRRNK